MGALRAKAAQEPVAVGAAFLVVVDAVLGFLVAAGRLDAALVAPITAVAAAIVGFVVRSRVTPVPAEERGW